jgi:hypothetical protein
MYLHMRTMASLETLQFLQRDLETKLMQPMPASMPEPETEVIMEEKTDLHQTNLFNTEQETLFNQSTHDVAP